MDHFPNIRFSMRGGYGDNKGGNGNDGGNLYDCHHFEPPGREEDNKGKLSLSTVIEKMA